ncbi:Indolepyruvate oxidoreductase subunit IorB / 2-oxoglutarate/2-oxoacid ferredoxin oxidoreductase, delta subunit, ferredoxin-like 4Fe-4S binding protein [hydrothermal vent metagenome]|uniref:Indolepyruvate oxidoreductase subunit IorB / 2-oxoglutarate/2-oxoacid ferredoxin oxidoreductase, delta subunit, ferredoxin-like 4Fe-4S binding protein n=1 Tax=hydrothermal vent metagenome TaxID=652676 RepID=A0A3B0TNP5_9ZZZZ
MAGDTVATALPAKQSAYATRPTNVLVVGVGGQGVIMVSKVLALLSQMQGNMVKQSEVHGMAKRGGAVFSHVRFGAEVWSPTIPAGEADVLLALEWAEGMRWLDYLNPQTGTFISDTQRIVPPFACRNRRDGATLGYARETPAQVLDHVSTGYALDAGSMAEGLGNRRVANTILLGVFSTALDFPVDDWQTVIARFVPPKTAEANEKAFLLGRQWVENADARQDIPAPSPAPTPVVKMPALRNEVEITAEWCKGCDICVKMCPERCLILNDEQIVELTAPDICTGCRLCEWLCPDFAIRIHRHAIAEESANP